MASDLMKFSCEFLVANISAMEPIINFSTIVRIVIVSYVYVLYYKVRI